MRTVNVNPGLPLKLWRISLGIRQYELSAQLGIAQCRLSQVEAGLRRLPPPQELKLRQLLGLDQEGGQPPAAGGDDQQPQP